MRLGEKLRTLRLLEGSLRGLGREMTQAEVSRRIREELGQSISQAYLSQIESGRRPHLTNTSRLLLARFFQVHPGYLVDDPEGYHTELTSHVRGLEGRLDLWLAEGAERFRGDADLARALHEVARHPDSRQCLLLLAEILRTPDLPERLHHVFRRSHSDAEAAWRPERPRARQATPLSKSAKRSRRN
jgi:transcriptional regulator with XRE-family HTH domain